MKLNQNEREQLVKMLSCNHIFTSDPSKSGLYCLKCGVTNLYETKDMTSMFEEMISTIFCMTKENGIILEGNITYDIESAKQKYKEILESHPNANNEEIVQYFINSSAESSKQKSKSYKTE